MAVIVKLLNNFNVHLRSFKALSDSERLLRLLIPELFVMGVLHSLHFSCVLNP